MLKSPPIKMARQNKQFDWSKAKIPVVTVGQTLLGQLAPQYCQKWLKFASKLAKI